MPKPGYTSQDLRIYQSLLDGASDEWITEHLSVDATQILDSKNRMTRAIASWFNIDDESVGAFVDKNEFQVLSRLMSAYGELSRIARFAASEENREDDDSAESPNS